MKSSAQLFALVLLCSSSLARAEGSAPISLEESARAHQRRGAELFERKEYRAALYEFQRAYDKAPQPRLLYEMGRAKLELRDYLGAARSYQRYIDESSSRERPAKSESRPGGAAVSITITMQYHDVGPATVAKLQALAAADQESALRLVFEQLAAGHESAARPDTVTAPASASEPTVEIPAAAPPVAEPAAAAAGVAVVHSRIARGIDADDPYMRTSGVGLTPAQ